MTRLLVISSVWFLAVAGTVVAGSDGKAGGGSVAKAVAVLHPTEGNKVGGTIQFARDGGKIKVSGEVSGLAPGEHGFHIHEFGDCSCADAKCAGDHFNPHGQPHAAPTEKKRHVGDLGNIRADDSGKASVSAEDSMLRLEGKDSIIGRAVVVHAKADDLKSQPSGEAGPRVACGVVGIAKP